MALTTGQITVSVFMFMLGLALMMVFFNLPAFLSGNEVYSWIFFGGAFFTFTLGLVVLTMR